MKRTNIHLTAIMALALCGAAIHSEPVNFPEPEVQLDRIESRNNLSRISSMAPGEPDIVGNFASAIQWLLGVNSNGESFGGGLFKGVDFFGSNIAATDYVPVEIRFSTHPDTTSLCGTFRRDLGYAANGVGTFPGAAYDMSDPLNPRRLNICFVEDFNVGIADLQWAPIISSTGGREYIYVMKSDYDGTGMTYAAFNGISGAPTMDIYYNIWGKLGSGNTVLQTLPATFTITPFFVKGFRAVPDSGQLLLTWNYDGTPDKFRVYGDISSPATTLLVEPLGTDRQSLQIGLTNGITYFYRVEAVDVGNNVIGTSPEISASPTIISNNMTLDGVWNGRSNYGDCWGYIDPATNKEYALICARDEGVAIIDIAQSPPAEVGFIPSINPGNDAKDVKIYLNYAIVLKENEPIQVVDITDVTAPVEVSQIVPINNGAHNCMVDGDHLFVVGDHGTGGLEIFSLLDPFMPVSVGSFQPFYYHDIAIWNDTLACAGINGNGVDLLDVSDRTNPFRIGSFNYSGSGTHNCEFSADGRTLFTGDEIGTAGTWTRVWDISDYSNITKITDIIVNASAIVHNFYRVGDTLYIAHYTEGLRVFDISDPANPFEIAWYDTFPAAGNGFGGAWNVYPFFPSGKLIVSDFNTGLYVITLDNSSPSCCVGVTGNVDADPADICDIADLTFLIDHLFINFPVLVCPAEANIDGDPMGNIDIADLTFMIDKLFINFPPAAACQ